MQVSYDQREEVEEEQQLPFKQAKSAYLSLSLQVSFYRSSIFYFQLGVVYAFLSFFSATLALILIYSRIVLHGLVELGLVRSQGEEGGNSWDFDESFSGNVFLTIQFNSIHVGFSM